LPVDKSGRVFLVGSVPLLHPSEIPAPLVAEMLGYSDEVTQKHAAEAGRTWARYVTR
jgi:hypothetical protein